MLDYSYWYLERKFYQKKCLDLNLHDFHPDTPPPFFVSYEKRFDQNWIFPSTGVCFTKKLIIKLWNYEFQSIKSYFTR